MREVSIKKATVDELRWFAKVPMGLSDISDQASSEQIRAKLKAVGWDKDHITVNDDAMLGAAKVEVGKQKPPELDPDDQEPAVDADTGETEAATKRRNEVSGRGDPKVKIFVPKQPGQGGDRAISVGVNGTHILIPREQECDVPLRYVQVLKNAISTEFETQEDGTITSRDVQLTPFNVIEGREFLT